MKESYFNALFENSDNDMDNEWEFLSFLFKGWIFNVHKNMDEFLIFLYFSTFFLLYSFFFIVQYQLLTFSFTLVYKPTLLLTLTCPLTYLYLPPYPSQNNVQKGPGLYTEIFIKCVAPTWHRLFWTFVCSVYLSACKNAKATTNQCV